MMVTTRELARETALKLQMTSPEEAEGGARRTGRPAGGRYAGLAGRRGVVGGGSQGPA